MFEIGPSASPLLCSAWNLTQIPHVATLGNPSPDPLRVLLGPLPKPASTQPRKACSSDAVSSITSTHHLTSRQPVSRLNTAPEQAAGSERAHVRVVPRTPLQPDYVFII